MKFGVGIEGKYDRSEYKTYIRVSICRHASEVAPVFRGQIGDVSGMSVTVHHA